MIRLEQHYDVGYTKSFFDTETVYGIGQHESSGCIVEGRVYIFCRLFLAPKGLKH